MLAVPQPRDHDGRFLEDPWRLKLYPPAAHAGPGYMWWVNDPCATQKWAVVAIHNKNLSRINGAHPDWFPCAPAPRWQTL